MDFQDFWGNNSWVMKIIIWGGRVKMLEKKRFETVIALEKLNGDLIDSWNKICRGKLFRKIDRSRSDRKKGCIERYTIVEGEINVQKLIILAYINIRWGKETKVEYRFRYIYIKKPLHSWVHRIMKKKKGK